MIKTGRQRIWHWNSRNTIGYVLWSSLHVGILRNREALGSGMDNKGGVAELESVKLGMAATELDGDNRNKQQGLRGWE